MFFYVEKFRIAV